MSGGTGGKGIASTRIWIVLQGHVWRLGKQKHEMFLTAELGRRGRIRLVMAELDPMCAVRGRCCVDLTGQ